MRPATTQAPSPADPTGDRPHSRRPGARKARLRRMAIEALEGRALMATLPLAPTRDPEVAFDFNGLDAARTIPNSFPGDNGDSSAPSIAVNRYDPNKLVAVWTLHDETISDFTDYFVRGAFSTNAGLSWQPLPGLPGVRIDIATLAGTPVPYAAVTQPTVAFDGKDNFYVLEIQHSDSYGSGDLLLQPYDFSGAAPVAGATTRVAFWNQADATNFPVRAVRDAVVAADDNLASFTDPATGATQADAGAGRIYIASETDVPPPQNYTGPWNRNTIELQVSLNGGASFGTPVGADVGHFVDPTAYGGSAPRIAISQGDVDGDVTGGQVTLLFDDHAGGGNFSPPVDRIFATPFTPTPAGFTAGSRVEVARTTVRGAVNSPYPLITPATPGRGVGPGAVIASDNTLGSFSTNQGRIYVAYVDRYDTVRVGAPAAENPADNTDVFLKFSDDGGLTWNSGPGAFGIQVNDDRARTDGFSEALVSQTYITGRSQFLPQLAVDAITGTLAISYEDTRHDASRSRTVESIQLSGDGGKSFSPSVYADAEIQAFDQTTQRFVSLGPIPANKVGRPEATGTELGAGGIGDRQGLAIHDGRLYAAFATNLNGGVTSAPSASRPFTITVAPMLYQVGPRVVSSTMGQVAEQAVTDRATGLPIRFNVPETPSGPPRVDGFVVTFDRPVDPATFTAGDVTIVYRDASTPGSQPGNRVPVGSVTALAGGDPLGPTSFLVRFAEAQQSVGTYSYEVGPNVRDLSRGATATNLHYAAQTPLNLPSLPPSGTGGQGTASRATSVVNIAGTPADQGILDLDVLVSLEHERAADLVLRLVYQPAGGGPTTTVLLAQNVGGGSPAGFVDTRFDDQARRSINGLGVAAPFSGRFRPAGSLASFRGLSPNGTWTLQVDDTADLNVGKLLSWGLKVTTSTRSFDGRFAQSGNAAVGPDGRGGRLMDQDRDGLGGENPNAGGIGPAGSLVFGASPGDVYAAPRPAPSNPAIFDGRNVNPPYDPATLPLLISGPRILRSFVPGAASDTADNLITDAAVLGFNVVFDRDMNPDTVEGRNRVERVSTPYGVFRPGDVLPDGSTLVLEVVRAPNTDPGNPNSDPDLSSPRTYQVRFLKLLPGATEPVDFPQVRSGTYSVTFASDAQSRQGDALDTNGNAGLDFLRGTPSAGTLAQSYPSQAAVPLGPGASGQVYESAIDVPASFPVKDVNVGLNIEYPRDRFLTATLVAPDGFEVLLFSGVGDVGTGANFSNTVLDDEADTPIGNGGPPFFGRFKPQLPLSQFVDHFSAGRWRLRVRVDEPLAGPVGRIVSWSLTLAQPLSNSGLGEPVADQATESFRIFTFDPTDPISSNTWTAVGPAGVGARQRGGNAEVAGRVGAIAVDPSDPSGNTVYVGTASGGVWKTTNFLTKDPAGPSYVALTDDATIFALNIASIAVFPRNNDPSQSIIFAATGDADAAGDPAQRGLSGSQRGVGFLRSLDGGATWTLLDSRDNTSAGGRDHFFASVPGQAGVTSYKILVDPAARPDGEVVVYAALSDLDAGGNLIAGGPKGGLWKSINTGRTWTQQRGGQATDVVLDLKGTNADSGNVDFLYAAFRGDGVYSSPNAGVSFELMTGGVGVPLIQNADFAQPQPVAVGNLGNTPNGARGRIVLSKPALSGDGLADEIYRGWLYAAVVTPPVGDQVEATPSSFFGLYLTKDFGQTWTQVRIPQLTTARAPELPSNDVRRPDVPISGSGTAVQTNFALGNFALSLAVDPNDANVVYLGGSREFRGTGFLRVDTTGIRDAHAFYTDGSTATPGLRSNTADSAVIIDDPGVGIYGTVPPSFDPYAQPNINLIRDPGDPFNVGATILVHNVTGFVNDGGHTKWTRIDRAVAPDPYASPFDPRSVPTRDIHEVVPIVDPLTGGARLLVATDQGVYSSVVGRDGLLIGSVGGVASTDSAAGDQSIVNGSRNGNLAIAQVRQGAAQPSQLAADLSVLRGFFYGNTQDAGIAQSDPGIIDPMSPGYGNLSYNVPFDDRDGDGVQDAGEATVNGFTVNRGTGQGLATQQNVGAGLGALDAYRISEDLVSVDGRPATDAVQVNSIGRTFGMYQQSNQGNTPDPQWPFRQGYNLAVNPLSGDQMLISSEAGRVFATTNRGTLWSEIGNPGALDGSPAQAIAYGAPDPAPPGGGLGNLNNYILAGTRSGRIFVTFTGGGGAGNQWAERSGGLDGSPVRMIVTNPERGSHEAYAVTEHDAYHMADTRSGGAWTRITGNLRDVALAKYGNSSLTADQIRPLTSIQADWRYLIPDDFASPSGPSHPMLYAAGEAGVFRSLDDGRTWGPFPDAAVNLDGTTNASNLLSSPAGPGGGLPTAAVVDLDLSLGNVDPTNGRPGVASGPNVLVASTYGRGAFAIRLAPIVFPNTAANGRILTLSTTKPAPPGTSDSGIPGEASTATDLITNVTRPVIEGLSEQSAFGNEVTVDLYDVSALSDAQVADLLAGVTTLAELGVESIGTGTTDSSGRFAVRVVPDHFLDDGSTDGPKRLLVQASNGSGTKGNLASLGFLLDTTEPEAPGAPDLAAASDSGLFPDDNVTNVKAGLQFSVLLPAGEPNTTRVYLVRDGDSKVVDTKFGTAGGSAITLIDPGPVSDGVHVYRAYQVDVAGNVGPFSGELRVTVDTKAPDRPNAPVLDSENPQATSTTPKGSDSGAVGDNITNVRQPFLAGFAPEAGGQIQIIDSAGNVLAPPATPPASNVGPNQGYSVRPNSVLADGTYSLRVRQRDLAGNLSPPSPPLSVTILSRTPARPTLELVAADDSGVVGDNITNNKQPRLVGTGEPGLKVELVLVSGTVPDGSGVPGAYIPPGGVIAPAAGGLPIVIAADGTFTVRFPQGLPDGPYVVRARTSDVAGNSAESLDLALRILGGGIPGPVPTPTPGAPTLQLNPVDDTGIRGDNATVLRRPKFIGAALTTDGKAAANVAVDLVDTRGTAATGDDVVLATTTSTTTGNFTISLPNDLSNGRIRLAARVRDVAGNPGPNSDVLPLSVYSVLGDANADGRADLDSFSRATSKFSVVTSPGVDVGAAPFPTSAASGDIPLAGDFDGDGRVDYGFYRYATGQWFVRQSRAGDLVLPFGVAGDALPIPADFDGDNVTDFATYRPSTGAWTFLRSATATVGTFTYGTPADRPMPADYDGDNLVDFAVYNPEAGLWQMVTTTGIARAVRFGKPNVDVPVPGDYDGDKKADVATYRPTTGEWFFTYATGATGIVRFGKPNVDVPAPGDYNGDGKDDLTLYRPNESKWYILETFPFGRVLDGGTANSVPLLAPLQPYRFQGPSSGTRSAAGGAGFLSASEAVASPATPAPSSAPDLGRTAASFAAGAAPVAQAGGQAQGRFASAAARRHAALLARKRARIQARAEARVARVAAHPHDAAIEGLGDLNAARRRPG